MIKGACLCLKMGVQTWLRYNGQWRGYNFILILEYISYHFHFQGCQEIVVTLKADYINVHYVISQCCLVGFIQVTLADIFNIQWNYNTCPPRWPEKQDAAPCHLSAVCSILLPELLVGLVKLNNADSQICSTFHLYLIRSFVEVSELNRFIQHDIKYRDLEKPYRGSMLTAQISFVGGWPWF